MDLKLWKKSGEISRDAREYGKTLVKEGASVLEIAEKIEERIIKLGGKPSFPVDISINHVAAHASPFPDDKDVINAGDIVKLDLGAHIDGHVTDTAATVDLNKDRLLVKAADESLREAVKLAKAGTKVSEIGQVIQDKIREYGFASIRNLSGHGLDIYKIHANINIPNYNNKSEVTLEDGMIITIEPFPTTGEGLVVEGKPTSVYKLEVKRPVRDKKARDILDFIEFEYRGLPFSSRWILKEFPNSQLILKNLEKQGIVHNYKELVEKSKGLVSQSEVSLIVGKGIIT